MQQAASDASDGTDPLAGLSEAQIQQLLAQFSVANGPSSIDDGGVTVTPDPGFVVKTTATQDAGGGEALKVMINVCSSEHVPPLKRMKKLDDAGVEQEGINVPLSVGPLKKEVDKSGAPCEVVDVVVHPGVLADCDRDVSGGMRHFVVELALQYVERKYSLRLSHGYRLPRAKYTGLVVTPQRMRKQAARAGIAEVQPQQQRAAAAAKGASAYSLLSELGAVPVAGAELVPSSRQAASRAAAAAAAATASAPSPARPARAARGGGDGQALPLDIQLLTPLEGDAKAQVAAAVARAAAGGAADADAHALKVLHATNAPPTAGAAQPGSSPSLLVESSTARSGKKAAALSGAARLARELGTLLPLPAQAAVFAVLPALGAGGPEEDGGGVASAASRAIAGSLVELARSDPGPPCLLPRRRSGVDVAAAADGESSGPQPAAASPDAARAWLRQHAGEAVQSIAVDSAGGGGGEYRVQSARDVAAALGPAAAAAEDAAAPSASGVVLGWDDVVEHATGALLRVHFPILEVTDGGSAETIRLPAAPLLLGDVSASISLDKLTVRVSAAGYQGLSVTLPWPSVTLGAGAAGAGAVGARFDAASRLLLLHLPRDMGALDAAALPPLPVAALSALLSPQPQPPQPPAGGCDGGTAVEAVQALPAPYLRSLLRRYVEADARSSAPDAGSRQWLLAHALDEFGGLEQGGGGSSGEQGGAAAAATGPAASAGAAAASSSGGGGGGFAEDRFLQADALSAHFLRQREEDRMEREGRAAEAAAERARAAEAEMLAAARREVAAEAAAAKVAAAAAAVSAATPDAEAAAAVGLVPPAGQPVAVLASSRLLTLV